MFVRWKYNKSKAGRVVRAVLVRSVWEGGKPRQRTITELDSKLEADVLTKRETWMWFFLEVTYQLSLVEELTSSKRLDLVGAFLKRYPKPPK